MKYSKNIVILMCLSCILIFTVKVDARNMVTRQQYKEHSKWESVLNTFFENKEYDQYLEYAEIYLIEYKMLYLDGKDGHVEFYNAVKEIVSEMSGEFNRYAYEDKVLEDKKEFSSNSFIELDTLLELFSYYREYPDSISSIKESYEKYIINLVEREKSDRTTTYLLKLERSGGWEIPTVANEFLSEQIKQTLQVQFLALSSSLDINRILEFEQTYPGRMVSDIETLKQMAKEEAIKEIQSNKYSAYLEYATFEDKFGEDLYVREIVRKKILGSALRGSSDHVREYLTHFPEDQISHKKIDLSYTNRLHKRNDKTTAFEYLEFFPTGINSFRAKEIIATNTSAMEMSFE